MPHLSNSELISILAIIFTPVGALIGFLASRWSFTASSKRANKDAFCNRMEKAYLLRQRIYDKHKIEVDRLLRVDSRMTKDEWLNGRNHPGEIMSELRMLINIYAPTLNDALKDCADSHDQLKKLFREIDELVRGDDLTKLTDSTVRSAAEAHLKNLADRTSVLRDKIVGLVQKALQGQIKLQ